MASYGSAGFDRVLLRPCSIIVQVAGSYFHIHRISRVFGGSCAIAWCLWKQQVQLTPINILTIVLALAGGFLLIREYLLLHRALLFLPYKLLIGYTYLRMEVIR